MPGFNPRDFLSLNDSVNQSRAAQATPASTPSSGGWRPQYAPEDAYSTTVMPETGAPGPNHSLAGNRNYASIGTANDLAKMYGGRVLQANMAQGPTRTNTAQYAIDFGTGDPLNAGLLAARYDESDPTRDKFWADPFRRDQALQAELNYGAQYVPNAAPRHESSFEGPSNNPNYQWHAPEGGANYLQGGKAPIATAKLNPQGAGFGMPGQRPANAATSTANMSLPGNRYGNVNRPSSVQPRGMYGARPSQASSYGAMRQPQRPQAQRTTPYRPAGMPRTF